MLSASCPAPDLDRIAARIEAIAATNDFTLVEGAGGLLVPLDENRTIADLAQRLQLPLILVAPDRLGVLSHVLTACESAAARSLQVAAVILTHTDPADAKDPSRPTNAEILAAKLHVPVRIFPPTPDDDEALATAIESRRILDLLPS
jgi:dethiobiotin synthetase